VARVREESSPSCCACAGSFAGIILCIGLLSSAKVAIEATPALASTAATTSLFILIMMPLKSLRTDAKA